MSTITSISELLTLSGSQYRVYDIGRRIDKISKTQFEKIEANQLPYPYPSQGHALLAIAFWQKSSASPYIWFIKLPLDERGLLNQGARNHFIAIIIEALGADLTVDPNEQQAALLEKNPYHFTPPQYKLALMNSILSYSLKQKPSQYYDSTRRYLTGELGWDNWQQVGIQGLSDFAIRLAEENNQEILLNALEKLPEPVLTPLCHALENVPMPAKLINAFVDYIDNTKQLQRLQIPLLRALAASSEHKHSQALVTSLLTEATLDDELLIILGGRVWPTLSNDTNMLSYLEHLANSENKALFSALFRDIVAIPTLRTSALQAIRSPARSENLALAIGQLFKN